MPHHAIAYKINAILYTLLFFFQENTSDRVAFEKIMQAKRRNWRDRIRLPIHRLKEVDICLCLFHLVQEKFHDIGRIKG